MKRLYPVMLGVYPVLFLYARNQAQIRPGALFLALGLAVILTLLIWIASRIITADSDRACVFTAAALAVFYGFGHIYAAVAIGMARLTGSANPATNEIRLELALVALSIVLLAALFKTIRRAPLSSIRQWGSALTVAAVLLVSMPLATAATSAITAPKSSGHDPDPDAVVGSVDVSAPDIYDIVLDGYARHDVLARHYDFDNSSFLDSLRTQGFVVAQQSNANFNWTFLSLGSMLNMEYVTDLSRDPGRDATDRTRAYRLLRDNRVARFLKNRGYTTFHFSSTWEGTFENPYADVEIRCRSGWFQDNYYRALAESSVLRMWTARITADLASCHQAQLLALENVATRRGPKFVFAHFIPPHHPYLFDRNGNVLRRATVADQFQFNLGLWARRDLYIDQLAYMNERILHVVGAILKQSARPAIIVLHSDHGPQLLDAQGRVAPDNTRARFANLLAIKTPDNSRLVPDDVTLVNVYRLLLNRYFAATLDTLPSQHYFSTYRQPYAFQEISRDVLTVP